MDVRIRCRLVVVVVCFATRRDDTGWMFVYDAVLLLVLSLRRSGTVWLRVVSKIEIEYEYSYYSEYEYVQFSEPD